MHAQGNCSSYHPATDNTQFLASMEFSIGDKVFLSVPMPYLKTADPMPMLRPPELVSPDEQGLIVGLRVNDIAEVRFRRGNFLIPIQRLTIYNSKNKKSES